MERKFALIGFPLGHSMSKPIHQKLFELSKKQADYNLIEISPDDLKNEQQKLKSLFGYNITIPHKESIIPFLDELDGSAKRYSAVNCVLNQDGYSTGYNTDCYGFLRTLEANNLWIDNKVLLLGLGGAGKMMAVETIINSGELTIAVRKTSIEKAEKFAEQLRQKYIGCNVFVCDIENIDGHFDILLNATPVGMYPHCDGCPVSDTVADNCDALFDAIYNPSKTLLMQKFTSKGKKAVGGMGMLVWQAVVAHEIWDNIEYNQSDIIKLISDMEKLVEEKF